MARRFRAPGRVNLIGEHTDYSGGLVLPAALDRCVTVEAELNGARIRLVSDRMGDDVDVAADGSQAPASGWGRYVAAVAAELDALGRPPVGLAGQVSADLPDGAGLSSSAALEVAVALALCAAASFPLEPLELAAVAQRAEHRAVGVPCGIMDQAASVLGRSGHAVLLDCATLDHELVAVPDGVGLVVVDSAVTRRLEDSGYAQRRAELEAGLPALHGRRPSQVDSAELEALLRDVDELPARRVRHVVGENARVRLAAQAMAADDRQQLRILFAESHASLRDDFEVSTPELDLLVDLALAEGAFAARMTGGGFGGAIVALCAARAAAGIGERVAQAYQGRTGRSATVIVAHPGDGAAEVA